jgi:hypothetical protein
LNHFPSVKKEQVIKFLEASGMGYFVNHSVPEKSENAVE